MKKLLLLLPLLLLAACADAPVGNVAVPQPAKPVELSKYLGRWYELARYTHPFEEGCEAVTADYSLREDGMLKVINRCHQGSPKGELSEATGKAKIVEGSKGAKLRVSFFGPFYGNYWVLDRADDYAWSIVGEPSGKYLWILTRKATPTAKEKAALVARVKALGYNTEMLYFPTH